ncbi:hypothetical protein NN3_25710 [Nocardia neocaledoniensis NBRC 108232]|uniref:Uncharacterized protein n=1 Tax=Nocardia neocaledoniensis TaxID=236511 RepID=A0A317NR33_9NOCA|nr:hypothetical protein [Nocardia neocaledoniensis]PWV77760.1 hypothetical protein DFR69_103359 [Nocardia neocaledoniensis]GEM31564.1 hypothetical protein NN3_25710 [Nocardia neocaledoniensis NBRC 108232]
MKGNNVSYWRPVVNTILYSIQFERALDDRVVDRIAHTLVTQPLATLVPEDEYGALVEGIATREPIPTLIQLPHPEAELREFLGRVVARMDEMRPWPTLPYLRMPKDSVSIFENAAPIARISASVGDIQGRISRAFYSGTEYGTFIPLKMASGRVVGMFTPFWSDSDDIVLVDATHDPDPHAAITELLSVTRIDPATVTRLTADDLEPFSDKYATTPIHDNFRGEHLPGNSVWGGTQVAYLTPEERERYRLTAYNGLLIDARGQLLDTSNARTLWSPAGGRAIFVMDSNGVLYSSPNHVLGEFHHSSFLAGEPAAGAGEIEARYGQVRLISDHSSHYRPARRFTEQVVDSLARQGVRVDDLVVEYHSPT